MALFGLSGCGDATQGLGGADAVRAGPGLFAALAARKPPETPANRAALARGDIVVQAPDGWCIEPHSLQNRASGSFALLAGCYALSEGRIGPRVPHGVLTLTVSERRPAGDVVAVDALGAVVSRGEVIGQDLRDGVALVRLRPAQAARGDDLGDPHWRAVFVHGGRAIALAAYGPDGGDLSGPPGRALLMRLVRGIRGNSPGLGA